ncbi:KilA-N domain-containing protein, partial [Ferrovum myxofaciens]|uniref:KilA-N domain-containing protein n=1 Tax=Ferrovum myxofaciens TaxID=416213 RepID=UPI000552BD58
KNQRVKSNRVVMSENLPRPVLEVYTRRPTMAGYTRLRTWTSGPYAPIRGLYGQGLCSGTGYCINDLHRAAGGEARHRPANWLQSQSAKELVAELENSDDGIPSSEQNQSVSVTKGGV